MADKKFWDEWTKAFEKIYSTKDLDRNRIKYLMERQEFHTEFNKIMEGVELEGYDEFARN